MTDILSGWSPTTLALLLAALTGGVLLVVLGLGASNRLLFALGLRNARRRPGQTWLMLAGLTLFGVFFSASFGVQKSFTQNIGFHRLMKMGNSYEAPQGSFSRTQVQQTRAHPRRTP